MAAQPESVVCAGCGEPFEAGHICFGGAARAEKELCAAFDNLMQAWGIAAELGVDAQAVVVGQLRLQLGERFNELPITVRMLLA